MTKLVVLKFGKGSFDAGFPVTLQIGEENSRAETEVIGELPPDEELPVNFNCWQTIYRNLDFSARPKGLPKLQKVISTDGECLQAAQKLRDRLNQWLQSQTFRNIREKWLEKLQKHDQIRVILQTEDYQLQKLPWHLWELIERYPNAEIALAAPSYEKVSFLPKSATKVKILALLGDSHGVDIATDRQLLEQLPDTNIHFLVEPSCEDLTDNLWQQNWDILFFAGHSSSHTTGETGQIYINQTESLTISQLKYALKQAVDRGLKLAIFNSCDGLGLAREFASLQIPQLIVMREPVPDRVAQTFLKHFLQAYSQGQSLYLAVRIARERLQGLDGQFPCASWLPVIYQNLAEIPPSWDELGMGHGALGMGHGVLVTSASSPSSSTQSTNKVKRSKFHLLWLIFISLITGGLVVSVRYLGMLQKLELQAFDRLQQLRPHEEPESRLLVVTITEEDVQSQSQERPQGSLSDESLLKLLKKLEAYQPQAIGLDIYRDRPVKSDLPELQKHLYNNKHLISVCRVSDPLSEHPGIKPPPEISLERLGFSDLVFDADNIVRRHLLALTPPPSSPCKTSYSFSVQLALRYLAANNISLKFTSDGAWKLGKTTFKPLTAHTGGYQGIDASGHQILLNYRSHHSLKTFVPQVTLTEVVTGKVNASTIKNRIVLIGTTAQSFQDYSSTPYITNEGAIEKIPGVVLQAQMISQLLSAVLDERSLLSTWYLWQEIIWILAWSVTASLLAYYIERLFYLTIVTGITIASLYGICLIFLIKLSIWIPLVPPIISFMVTLIVTTYFMKNYLNFSKPAQILVITKNRDK
ncbi:MULTISPECIES: CHASE2 domain-containing protein [Nostoc]|uniref:CHASE2 domain-containing protein n=1 Tax=Nostoc paludosum FACHB-159 TaxID=2692908 RepID=A0ABR8K7V7_9NOSO|nr:MULTISPECIES: CHASE2 domain-containing protein [Nostoc]MBD2677375.1 CHASE2 domain-containing protein [Nostoc sp. FACHB-857]MBD2734232.1 CHASE2 domain-containing protein [Nostoc paludosum FACHB-159]